MKWIISGLALLTGVTALVGGLLIGSANNRIGQLQQTIEQEQAKLARVNDQLRSTSPFGDLISCADLQEMQRQFAVTGVDGTGTTVYSSEPGNPWLPSHCFKQ